MSVTESFCGQYNFYGSLFTKYVVYGSAGLFLILLKYNKVSEGLHKLANYKTKQFLLLIVAVLIGTMGTYFMYCAFDICGDNKNVVLIIAYCVPVLVIALLTYFFLGETLNFYAVIGILLIVLGVLLIKLKGTKPVIKD
jgi:drug/metabolite transporter (DMT)-like permease